MGEASMRKWLRRARRPGASIRDPVTLVQVRSVALQLRLRERNRRVFWREHWRREDAGLPDREPIRLGVRYGYAPEIFDG